MSRNLTTVETTPAAKLKPTPASVQLTCATSATPRQRDELHLGGGRREPNFSLTFVCPSWLMTKEIVLHPLLYISLQRQSLVTLSIKVSSPRMNLHSFCLCVRGRQISSRLASDSESASRTCSSLLLGLNMVWGHRVNVHHPRLGSTLLVGTRPMSHELDTAERGSLTVVPQASGAIKKKEAIPSSGGAALLVKRHWVIGNLQGDRSHSTHRSRHWRKRRPNRDITQKVH